jgi:hypothetical protein
MRSYDTKQHARFTDPQGLAIRYVTAFSVRQGRRSRREHARSRASAFESAGPG